MNTSPDYGLSAQVARALAESDHLRIDPSELEYLADYDTMIGGFGTVRVAKLGDQMVAVKELRIAGSRNDRARFSMRFARELKVWAPLDHPNLLKLSGFHTDDDMSIAQFICPFYTHGHIRNYINANQPNKDTRFKLAEDTALGLQHLHDLKIAHGDLKELNVLVDPEPRALLCDYGLSKMLNPDGATSGLTTTGMFLSIRFASPEILNGSRPDLPSDIWAWGCLFLKIIADIGPYEGTLDMACMMKIFQGTPPAEVSTLSISPTLRTMVKQCWDLDPYARPTIQQCIDSLESTRPAQKPIPPPLIAPPPVNHMPPVPPAFSVEPFIWDASSQKSMEIIGTHTGYVCSIGFSPDGSLLASACGDEKCRLWGIESNAVAAILDCAADVTGVAFSSNGMQLACALKNGSIALWDSNPGTISSSSANSMHWKEKIKIQTAEAAYSVAFSPTGLGLAAGLKSGVVQMWDESYGKPLFTLTLKAEGGQNEVHMLAFSPDGRWLAFCSGEKTAWVQDTVAGVSTSASREWAPLVKLEHDYRVHFIAFSKTGGWLASCTSGGEIILRNVASWIPFTTWVCNSSVESLVLSPGSTQVIAGTYSGEIQIWDVASSTLVVTLKGHTKSIGPIAVSPDGRRIASGSHDNSLRMWSTTPKRDHES